MSETLMWVLSALGLVAIALLIHVIKKQLSSLKNSPNSGAEATDASHGATLVEPSAEAPKASSPSPKAKRSSLDLKESITVIATLTLDDQVELSEASIRLKVLLDHYDSSLHKQDDFRIFSEVYAALEHMPTHAERKKTDKRFLHKLDQERFAIEAKHRDAIRAGAQALLKHLDSPKLNLVKNN